MARRAFILVEGGARTGMLYVEAAQRLGLHPIMMSADPAQYDYLAAQNIETIRVDTGNLDALIRECSRLRATYDIAGITSVGDLFYATAGNLCRCFDLPGPDPASVERCCDKFTQRQLLAQAGVPVPAYRVAANAADIESSAAVIGLPVIVKPAVGSGSRGVRLCRDNEELAEHAAYLLDGNYIWGSSPRILVEEFADGPYYCADIMGKEVVAISAADSGPSPHFVFRELTYPAPLTEDECSCIADVSLSCLRALGLGWGPTCIEFRWTSHGPVVIEVNPRLGGAPGPQLVQLAYGIDIVTEHIKIVIGDKWDLRRRHSHVSAARILVADRDGTLDWIKGVSEAAAVPGVSEVKLYVGPKASIVTKGDLRDWMGYVAVASPSFAETEAILERAVEFLSWSITPDTVT
ncbi:ATP-grasp domain-containing protein [Mesorhizobium waimense]|uniref:ATP-grasp domain-containing protein n=1 Tax=Mesorhizobium waimense TaxID=1300307 RepID=A0A3A5JUJ9_9HYPH|nr:acetyl-CoA carboxylase biotin carboxylase subunit family protein [Mesorhizobium waimense]RJT23983.1 ATP-grasp domain-containing protein [Mesorhizobium waimense]